MSTLYIHVCVCMYVHVHVCVWACVCTWCTCMCVCACACVAELHCSLDSVRRNVILKFLGVLELSPPGTDYMHKIYGLHSDTVAN